MQARAAFADDWVANESQISSSVGSTFTVYRFYSATRDLLYVGRTCRVENRLSEHRRQKDWWRDVAFIELDHFEAEGEMVAAEARQIAELHPLHNLVLQRPTAPVVWDERTPERSKRTPEPYLRPEEAAEALGWSTVDLEAAVSDGCPAWRFGRSRRFKWSEVQTWLLERGQ